MIEDFSINPERISSLPRPVEYDQQALWAIEQICGDDFCEDQEMQNLDREDGDLKTAIGKLTAIYALAHSHVKTHSCYHAHEDWRKTAHQEITEAAADKKCACPDEHGESFGLVCPVCGGSRD